MECRKNIKSDEDNESIWFTYNGQSCAFLDLDVTEHPSLRLEDREILGGLLLDTIEKYIGDKDKFRFEKHSSSIHIYHKHVVIAKVWHNELASSQIRNEESAMKVAKQLVNYIKDPSLTYYPKKRMICSPEFNYAVTDGDGAIAKFVREEDADYFLSDYANGKYNQKIVIGINPTNISVLMKEDSKAHTVELFHGFGVFPNNFAKKLLYSIREYIHDNDDILEA